MDEYISRKETVKAFCEKCKGYYDGHCIHRGECDIDVIKTAPAADVQPVDRWISVKDRLPENNVEVMLYDTDCGIVFGWYDDEIEDFVAEFISPLDAVTHWRSLPEPPKDGDING